jgi:hypothetical protein
MTDSFVEQVPATGDGSAKEASDPRIRSGGCRRDVPAVPRSPAFHADHDPKSPQVRSNSAIDHAVAGQAGTGTGWIGSRRGEVA